MIVQPETVKRWRRNGWWGLWRYRSGGRWRGGRPRVSREVRELITRMARENFLWGAPRIHGELLMLGFKVSEATVSRYLSTLHRHPGQSWRTFIRNQALGFSYRDELEYGNQGYQSLVDCSRRGKSTRSTGQIVRLDAYSHCLSYTRSTSASSRSRASSARLGTFRRETSSGRYRRRAPIQFQSQCRCEARLPPRSPGLGQNISGPSFEKRQLNCPAYIRKWIDRERQN